TGTPSTVPFPGHSSHRTQPFARWESGDSYLHLIKVLIAAREPGPLCSLTKANGDTGARHDFFQTRVHLQCIQNSGGEQPAPAPGSSAGTPEGNHRGEDGFTGDGAAC